MKKLRQGDLFRAMSDINAAYIDEAARPVSPKRIHPVRWAVLAACLSLAVGASVLLPLLMQEQPAISASDPGSSPAGGEPVAPPLSRGDSLLVPSRRPFRPHSHLRGGPDPSALLPKPAFPLSPSPALRFSSRRFPAQAGGQQGGGPALRRPGHRLLQRIPSCSWIPKP